MVPSALLEDVTKVREVLVAALKKGAPQDLSHFPEWLYESLAEPELRTLDVYEETVGEEVSDFWLWAVFRDAGCDQLAQEMSALRLESGKG